MDITWLPRRVDWNMHAWTMTTSLYYSVGAVDAVEWMCVLCGYGIQKWLSKYNNESASDFALSLNIPPRKLFGWFRRPQLWATEDWHIHHKTTHLLMHHILCRVFCQNSNHPGDSAPMQLRFGALWLLTSPKTTITFEKE